MSQIRLRISAMPSRQSHLLHRVARTLYVRESKEQFPVWTRTYNVRATQRLGGRIRDRNSAIEHLAPVDETHFALTHPLSSSAFTTDSSCFFAAAFLSL